MRHLIRLAGLVASLLTVGVLAASPASAGNCRDSAESCRAIAPAGCIESVESCLLSQPF